MYPWQAKPWQFLQQQHQSNRLGHAYLLTGPTGIGKTHFVATFAQVLLCEEPTLEGMACQNCARCCLFLANTHPDYYFITLEASAKNIKIEQIRSLINYACQASQYQGMKIIVITPADAMNLASANALLKTLEEPVPNTLLFLVTNNQHKLPATLRSRCQRIAFEPPSQKDSEAWVKSQITVANDVDFNLLYKLAQGAPLRMLSLLEEEELSLRQQCFEAFQAWSFSKVGLSETVKAWQVFDLTKLFFHLHTWVLDSLFILQNMPKEQLVNHDFYQSIQLFSNKTSPRALCDFLQKLQKTRYELERSYNLNAVLLLEDFLIEWKKQC